MGLVFPVVLLCNGFAAGVLAWGQLGGWPLMRSLPDPEYVELHRFFSTRYDPFMPICMIVTIVGDLILAPLLPGLAGAVLVVLRSEEHTSELSHVSLSRMPSSA